MKQIIRLRIPAFLRRAFILTVLAIVSVAAFQANGQSLRGEKTLGLQFGYVDHNRSAMAGIEFTYRMSQHLRLAPAIQYVVSHHNEDGLLIDLNLNMPFFVAPGVEFYSLAGIAYDTWSIKDLIQEGAEHSNSSRVSRLGLNLGGGFDFRFTPTLRFGIQAEYTIVKHFSGAVVGAKIAYAF